VLKIKHRLRDEAGWTSARRVLVEPARLPLLLPYYL